MSNMACDVDGFGDFGGGRGRQGSYPYPFLDPASQAGPKTWREIYEWGKLVLLRSPEFVDSNRKLYSYFATPVEFSASSSDDQELSTEESNNLGDLFSDSLGYGEHCLQLGLSTATFGSQIVTLQSKCKRLLVCPHPECGHVVDLLKGVRDLGMDFRFDMSTTNFLFRCPAKNCPNRKRMVPAIVRDWHSRSPQDLFIKQWAPDEMLIDYYVWTDSDDVYWRIPEYYKQAVRRGHLETIAEADLDVLEAIRKNKLFRFYRDRVFHAKELTIAGLGLRGKGIPKSLLLAPQIWMMQVLRHQNQVLGMDYLIPMGFFSMDDTPRSGEYSGPMSSMNVGGFAADINRAITEHRKDPTKRLAFPYTVRYQIAGGEAAQFAPVELLENSKIDIYDGGGVPLEMYRGSLNLQVMPVAARLFEASHKTIPAMYDRFAMFVARRVCEELSKPIVKAKHQQSSVVADIQRQAILMQGLQMGHVSREAVYGPNDIDTSVQRDKRMEELLADARAEQELNKKLEEEQLSLQMRAMPQPLPAQDPAAAGPPPQEQGGSQMPAGVDPSQGMAIAGMSIEELNAEAQRIGAQLIDPSIPQADVNRQLQQVKSQSPELHTLVRGAMDKMRSEASSVGQQAVLSGQV